ncbi:hypothetical protein MXB_1378, partial [Myxobolus squamalis]
SDLIELCDCRSWKLFVGHIFIFLDEDTGRENPAATEHRQSAIFSPVKVSPFFAKTYMWQVQFIIILSSNKGLSPLCLESSLFIDSIFRVLAAPSLQFLILKPLFYVRLSPHICKIRISLLQGFTHYHRLTEVLVVAEAVFMNFKKALLNTVRYEFTCTRFVGYYFQFGHKLYRKIINLRID